jgi:hypothetical protein
MKYIKLFENFKFFDFKETEDYQQGDYHQAIMNVGYNAYNKENIESAEDMFEYVESNFGKDFKMLIQIGNYNYQVGNGGHSQYWHNGYASQGSSGCMADHKDCDNLKDMIESIRHSIFYKKYTTPKLVVRMMEEYKNILDEYDERCDECNGQGYKDEDCDNCHTNGTIEDSCDYCDGDDCEECGGKGYIEEDCFDCNGQGYISYDCEYCDNGYNELHVDHLDDPYYNISDKFMEECNDFAKRVIDNYYNVNKAFKNINN